MLATFCLQRNFHHPLSVKLPLSRPQHRLLVSPRLRDEFGNGERFYANVGQRIALPSRRADRPNREFLEWHIDEVYKAS